MFERGRTVIGGSGVQRIQPLGRFRNATYNYDGQL